MNSHTTIIQQGRSKPLFPLFTNDRTRYRTTGNRFEKRFFNAMDHFFTLIILLSGEEESEMVSINHIL